MKKSLLISGLAMGLFFIFSSCKVGDDIENTGENNIDLNYLYDLNDGASSPPLDWSEIAGGASAFRTGIQLTNTGGSIFYIRSDLSIDNQKAFQIEAIVSAESLTVDGERGARMWVKFRDAGLPPARSTT